MDNKSTPECQIAAECLAGRFRILNRVITGVYDDALRPYGVRISQMNVLVAIAAHGPIRATSICRLLKLEKSTLSRDLDRLLDRGFVRSTPAEGRSQDLEATAAGKALIRKVKPAWEEAQKRVHEMLGPALTKGVFDALTRLRKADEETRS